MTLALSIIREEHRSLSSVTQSLGVPVKMMHFVPRLEDMTMGPDTLWQVTRRIGLHDHVEPFIEGVHHDAYRRSRAGEAGS